MARVTIKQLLEIIANKDVAFKTLTKLYEEQSQSSIELREENKGLIDLVEINLGIKKSLQERHNGMVKELREHKELVADDMHTMAMELADLHMVIVDQAKTITQLKKDS